MSSERVFNAWVLLRPSEEVPGQWIAHCLEFDVVSQGNSLQNAMAMVAEATTMVLLDDIENGSDPLDRRAPPECWGELYSLMKTGQRSTFGEIDSVHIAIAAVQAEIYLRTLPENKPTYSAPVAFGRSEPISQQLSC